MSESLALPPPGDLAGVRGAIYVPARAYNAPQFWKNFSSKETVRDLSYARTINLNALRVWVSYEYWNMAPDAFAAAYDDFLAAAAAAGIKIMPSLFESCGVQPTPEAMWGNDPFHAVCVSSPAADVVENAAKWPEVYSFVDWFMERFGSDDRQLAIEVMNEPHGVAGLRFARAMFKRVAVRRGTVPLTLGAIKMPFNIYFMEYGLDILQFHLNFPNSEEAARKVLQESVNAGKILDRPVWCTEWQRIRPSGSGWGQDAVVKEEMSSDYSSMAGIVASYPVGSFFWSLMVKPAYLPVQRRKGTINGLFNEDGSVWSLADARSIAGDPNLELVERRAWPSWGVNPDRS